ncbi:hypothetical protein [Umezakia ovalisporum]|uniref:hypothetical protein n=1 Tax=Umezakia ovalisporum TaxID=75695 RepID=UPI0035B97EC9
MMMNGTEKFSDTLGDNQHIPSNQADIDTVTHNSSQELSKIAFATFMGATLGALVGALAMRGAAQRVNKTVKNVGNLVKDTTDNFNQTIKGVGDAIKTVAEGVNDTVKDVSYALKGTAVDVNDTVKNTVVTVKGAAVDVNDTVQNTAEIVKGANQGISETLNSTVNIGKTAEMLNVVTKLYIVRYSSPIKGENVNIS